MPTRAARPCRRRCWCSSAPPEVINGQTIVNLPLFTLNPALVVSGYWTSALPAGYSNTVEILASGKVPGVLEPGESVTVPVYYAGMQQPWSFAETQFRLQPAILHPERHDVGRLEQPASPASSRRGSRARPGTRSSPGLTSQLGNTWGGYVKAMDKNATYLGQLGENVTDVSQLWQFAIEQADGLSPVAGPGQRDRPLGRRRPGTCWISAASTPTRWYAQHARPARLRLDRQLAVFAVRRLRRHRHGDHALGQQRVFQPDSRGDGYFAQPGDHGILDGGDRRHVHCCRRPTARSRPSTPTARSTTSRTPTATGHGRLHQRPAHQPHVVVGRIADDRLQRGRPDRSRSPAPTAARSTTPTTRGQHLTSVPGLRRQGHPLHLRRRLEPRDPERADRDHQPRRHPRDLQLRRGRPAGQPGARTAAPGRLSFSYKQGEVIVTDAAGDVSQYYFDDKGNLVKYVDPLGNVTFATYDSNGDLTSVTGPTGLSDSLHLRCQRQPDQRDRPAGPDDDASPTPAPTTCWPA